ITFPHGQHVRMQIRIASARARDRHGETDQFPTIKCSDNLAPDLRRDDKKTKWDEVDIVKIPDFFLQGDASFEFFDAFAGANHGSRRHSLSLACCHNDSISSRDAVSTLRPCFL